MKIMSRQNKMLKNKKGFRLLDDWAEMFALFLLFIGLVISLLSDAAIISYIMITICGFVVGRIYHKKKGNLRFPFLIIVLGFLIGYVIGIEINNRGKFIFIILFFIVGCYIGYYFDEKGYF
jgi:hypothetical protein